MKNLHTRRIQKKPIGLQPATVLLVVSLLLAACGPVEIYIEREATGTPILPQPLPSQAVTLMPTAQPSPTPVVAMTSLLPGGLPLMMVETHLTSSNDGWGIGRVDSDLFDHILITEDGGQTWRDRTPQAALLDAPPDGLVAVAHFASNQQAWVAYSGVSQQLPPQKALIWRTVDGGQSWTPSQPLNLAGIVQDRYQPASLGFRDARHGWMLVHLGTSVSYDYMAIFTTNDGGNQWQRVVSPDSHPDLMSCYKTGLTFTTPMNGWMVGECPSPAAPVFFYRTTDGGKKWEQVNLPPPGDESETYFDQPAQNCAIPGFIYTSSRSLILQVICKQGQSAPISWLYASGNSGVKWSARPLPFPTGSFDFISPEEGWFATRDPERFGDGGQLFRTSDGGRSWDAITPLGWSGLLDFADADTGLAIVRLSDREALVRTETGGFTWLQLKPATSSN